MSCDDFSMLIDQDGNIETETTNAPADLLDLLPGVSTGVEGIKAKTVDWEILDGQWVS